MVCPDDGGTMRDAVQTGRADNRLIESSSEGAGARSRLPLTHLQRLEADSIQIMREAISESEHPVMLYSIGKDSAVMLHLALKAFYPSSLPFPLLHVDTTWKFREMIAFRDEVAKLLVVGHFIHGHRMRAAVGDGGELRHEVRVDFLAHGGPRRGAVGQHAEEHIGIFLPDGPGDAVAEHEHPVGE